MKIYIDFDGTLYNTDKLYNDFINIFTKQNINKIEIKNYIDKLYSNNKNLNSITNNIIKKYNLDKNIIKEIENIYQNNLLFNDIIPFLEKYHNKYQLVLLTLASNKTFQFKKINNTKINKYFKKIIITTKDKSKLNIDYKNGIFIDNNPYELEKFYNSNAKHIIRIKRNKDKYSKINIKINIKEFKDFKELLESNYLEKLGE